VQARLSMLLRLVVAHHGGATVLGVGAKDTE
jgi:hypothetical protein